MVHATIATHARYARISATDVTDALGRVTSFAYDALDRQTTVTDALSHATVTTYDAVGNALSVADPLQRVTQKTYDALNRVLTFTDPAGTVTSYVYDASGNLLSSTTGGETTSREYDVLNRPISVTVPGAGKTATAYDAVGNVVAVSDALDHATTYAYDALNREVSSHDALGNQSTQTYDAGGNVVHSTDPLGHTTTATYDALGRLLTSTDARGGVTQYTYDAFGDRLTLVDPAGNTTTWTYDLLGRVATETNELGKARSYTYDAVGNRTLLTKPDGKQIQYVYDVLNRPTEEKWLTGGSVVTTLGFGYDAASELTSAADGATTIGFEYNSLGAISQETQQLAASLSVTLASSYDAHDRRTKLETSIGGLLDSTIDYAFNPGGLVSQIQQSGTAVAPKSVTYSYDAAGGRTGVARYADLANTKLVASTTNTFDASNRLTAIEHKKGTSVLASYALSWDDASRLTAVTSPADGLSSFAYDATDQLTAATYQNYADLSFSYDANGNRTGTGYSTGYDNQLVSGAGSAFTYDDNGNLISRTDSASGAVVQYSYDHRDRLTDVRFLSAAGGTLTKHVHYAYDALNRRISESIDSDGNGTYDTASYIVNDGQRAAKDNAGDEVLLRLGSNGAVQSRYLHGTAVDEVLAEENIDSVTGASDVLWALTDQQGSVRDLARYNSAADTTAVVDHLMYDAFGGTVSETDSAVEHLFAYTGREWDDAAQLQYNRARYYDPAVGRWINKDPLSFDAGDANLYRYVGNNPVNAEDPSGLQDEGAIPNIGDIVPDKRLQEALALTKLYLKAVEQREDYENRLRVLEAEKDKYKVIGAEWGRPVRVKLHPKVWAALQREFTLKIRAYQNDEEVLSRRLLNDLEDVHVPRFLYYRNSQIPDIYEGGQGGEAVLDLALFQIEEGKQLGERSSAPGLGSSPSPLDWAAAGGAAALRALLSKAAASTIAKEGAKAAAEEAIEVPLINLRRLAKNPYRRITPEQANELDNQYYPEMGQGAIRSAAQTAAPKGSVWDDLPLRSNSYGAAEQAAGSFVGRRIAASSSTADGLYKFVVDVDRKVWLAKAADDVPHSALIPRGQQVRGAGYMNIKNGRANVNGRSGHFMADEPFLGEQATLYDRAIRETFARHGIEVIDNNVGLGSGLLRPPGS